MKSPNSQLSHLTYSELLVVTPAEPTPEVQKPRKSRNQPKIKEKPRIVQKTLRNITWVMVWALPIAQTITHVMFRIFFVKIIGFSFIFCWFLNFFCFWTSGRARPNLPESAEPTPEVQKPRKSRNQQKIKESMYFVSAHGSWRIWLASNVPKDGNPNFGKICLSTGKCQKNHCKNQKKTQKIKDMARRRQRCPIDLSDFFWFFQWFFYNLLPLSRFRETYAKMLVR